MTGMFGEAFLRPAWIRLPLVPILEAVTQGIWKRSAIVDIKADEASNDDRITEWLHRMMALHRKQFHYFVVARTTGDGWKAH